MAYFVNAPEPFPKGKASTLTHLRDKNRQHSVAGITKAPPHNDLAEGPDVLDNRAGSILLCTLTGQISRPFRKLNVLDDGNRKRQIGALIGHGGIRTGQNRKRPAAVAAIRI